MPRPRRRSERRITVAEAKQLGDGLKVYRDWPVEFCELVLGVRLDAWQKWVVLAVARRAMVLNGLGESIRGETRVAVASSTGIGKNMVAACIALWFLVCFDNPKIIIVGPSDPQMDDVMWPELAKWINNSPIMKRLCDWQAESVVYLGNPTNAFISRRVANVRISTGGERHTEALAGIHEDNVFIIFDEASGVVDEAWDALLPTMTGPNNVALAIANPTRTSGMFFRIYYDVNERKFWRSIRVSSEPWPEEFAAKGKPDFISDRAAPEEKARLRALPNTDPNKLAKLWGLHPLGIAVNVIFSYDEVTQALSRKLNGVTWRSPVQIGLDVARMGEDKTVHAVRRGDNITRILMNEKLMSPMVVDITKSLCEEEGALTYWMEQCEKARQKTLPMPDRDEAEAFYARLPQVDRARYYPKVVVDMGGGYGSSGVYDPLWVEGYTNIIGEDFGAPAYDDQYADRATEMWAGTLKRMMAYLSFALIPPDIADILRTQLTTRPYDTDSVTAAKRERYKIMSKKDLRKRGIESPDVADAVCMACAEVILPGVY